MTRQTRHPPGLQPPRSSVGWRRRCQALSCSCWQGALAAPHMDPSREPLTTGQLASPRVRDRERLREGERESYRLLQPNLRRDITYQKWWYLLVPSGRELYKHRTPGAPGTMVEAAYHTGRASFTHGTETHLSNELCQVKLANRKASSTARKDKIFFNSQSCRMMQLPSYKHSTPNEVYLQDGRREVSAQSIRFQDKKAEY